MPSRYYIVTDADAKDAEPKERLVDAPNPASAIKHAAKRFSAKPASQRDVARLMQAGVKIETVGGDGA